MCNPKKEIIIPEGGAKPLAPYSPAIRFGNVVFTSGQIGLDPKTGELVTGGVESETRQALVNLKQILESAGSSMDRAIKINVFLRDINDYAQVNKIYGEFFTEEPPARAIIQGLLPASASVEFDAVAAVNESKD